MTDVQIAIVVITSLVGLLGLYLAYRLVVGFVRLLFGIPKPKRKRRKLRKVKHVPWGGIPDPWTDDLLYGRDYWHRTDPYGMVGGNPYNNANGHSPFYNDGFPFDDD